MSFLKRLVDAPAQMNVIGAQAIFSSCFFAAAFLVGRKFGLQGVDFYLIIILFLLFGFIFMQVFKFIFLFIRALKKKQE